MAKVIKAKINIVVLVRLFLIATILISVLYLYLVSMTVRAMVDSGQNFKSLQSLGQKYQKLENQYFGLLEKIDIDYAHQLGFVDQTHKADYIIRQASFARR